jgi:hypothetical protein
MTGSAAPIIGAVTAHLVTESSNVRRNLYVRHWLQHQVQLSLLLLWHLSKLHGKSMSKTFLMRVSGEEPHIQGLPTDRCSMLDYCLC